MDAAETMQSSKRLNTDLPKETVLYFPKNKLPNCWHDKARMNSLFAPFRAKTANPEDWESKLKFWKALINQWCELKGCSGFTINELKQVFKENGRSPACLETVVEEMFQNNETQLESTFFEPPQHSWTGWAVNTLMKNPLRWSFGKIKETVVASPKKDQNTRYVIVDIAKLQGDKILSTLMEKRTDNYSSDILSMALVVDHSQSLGITAEGAKFAIHSLFNENKISVSVLPARATANGDKTDKIIKLADSNGKCSPVTEADIGIYSLHQNEKNLIDEINKLEEKKDQLRVEAKQYLETNKRQMAKNCLKKKHIIDANIEKRGSQLENVQGLLARIQEAETNGRVVDSYQSGLAALKNSLKDVQPIKVQDIMEEIQETFEDQDEIQTNIGRNITIESEYDLESELAELMKDEENEDATKPGVYEAKLSDIELEAKHKINQPYHEIKNVSGLPTPVNQGTPEMTNILNVEQMLSQLPKVPHNLSPEQQAVLLEEQCTVANIKPAHSVSTPKSYESTENSNKLYPKLLSFDDFQVDDLSIDEIDTIDNFERETILKSVNLKSSAGLSNECSLESRLKDLRSPEK